MGKYVLVVVESGIIDRVDFFNNKKKAIGALKDFVAIMNEEKHDAAVHDESGLVANAKMYMKEEDLK